MSTIFTNKWTEPTQSHFAVHIHLNSVTLDWTNINSVQTKQKSRAKTTSSSSQIYDFNHWSLTQCCTHKQYMTSITDHWSFQPWCKTHHVLVSPWFRNPGHHNQFTFGPERHQMNKDSSLFYILYVRMSIGKGQRYNLLETPYCDSCNMLATRICRTQAIVHVRE